MQACRTQGRAFGGSMLPGPALRRPRARRGDRPRRQHGAWRLDSDPCDSVTARIGERSERRASIRPITNHGAANSVIRRLRLRAIPAIIRVIPVVIDHGESNRAIPRCPGSTGAGHARGHAAGPQAGGAAKTEGL